MEEDNIQYFNDEWNGLMFNNPELRKYQELYNVMFIKIEKLLQEELIKEGCNGITKLPKEFNNNYRQLECRCDLPKPNSFTGNCTNCNLIIKPIRDKDVNRC